MNSGLSRMRLRIIRTVARPSTLPDSSAKKPWLNVLAHSQRAREAVMAIEAAYTVRATNANSPISVPRATTIIARKNLLMPRPRPNSLLVEKHLSARASATCWRNRDIYFAGNRRH